MAIGELIPVARRVGLLLRCGRRCCHSSLTSWGGGEDLPVPAADRVWDARYPDFKHKETQEALWFNNRSTPPWVEAKLAAMAPGTVPMNIFSWNARLARYAKAGHLEKMMETFQQMQRQGMIPDRFTFVHLLNGCASLQALEDGRHIHTQIIQRGYESDVFVGTSLVDVYAKCGRIEDAQRVFSRMPTCDVVCWNTMILGHAKCGQGHKALELFQQMRQKGMQPTSVTFVGLLNACAGVAALEEGRRVHEQIVEHGCESDDFVASSLVDMYTKCGSIEDAQRVFNRMPTHNVVSWNALILGHVKCGQSQKAIQLFQQMKREEKVQPDAVTFAGVLNACASIAALEEGRCVHEQVVQSSFVSDLLVCNSLIDMYAKCGNIEDVQRVFSNMPVRDVVSWNSMILGHVKCGQGLKALELSRQMQCEGVQQDTVTFVGLLNACASVAVLQEGRRVHEQILQSGCESDVFVGGSLVDMYAKCGSIEDAQRVFNKMPRYNLVCWNALLGGYAMHGHAKEALAQFERMCQEGVEMDRITFVALLSACSHAGLVVQGVCYFESMGSVYGVPATLEHYACMVDLLGRAGHLQEAENIINTMTCKPNVAVWMTLLGACRMHGNVKMEEHIAKQVVHLDPGSARGCGLLSNVFAAAEGSQCKEV